jgi:hypothetical protein
MAKVKIKVCDDTTSCRLDIIAEETLPSQGEKLLTAFVGAYAHEMTRSGKTRIWTFHQTWGFYDVDVLDLVDGLRKAGVEVETVEVEKVSND